MPFGEYAASWIAERTLSETTRERYTGILHNHLRPTLGDRTLVDISAPVIRQRRHDRVAAGAGAAERTVLTVDQVLRLADAVPGRYRMLVLLAAFTSLRFGELAGLTRRDVDLDHGDVHVRRVAGRVG